MTSPSHWKHGAQELPETLQIAELLAELMPEAEQSRKFAPAEPQAEFATPSLAEEELGPPVDDTPPPVKVLPQTGPATYAVVESKPPVAETREEEERPDAATPPPVPAARRSGDSSSFTLAEFIIEQTTAAPATPPPLPAAPAAAAERIPLGDLTVAGYFSLVNWANDPAAVRHPPFAPRYDARTSAELRKIPFILLDEPAVDDSWSVAAVLKSFAW